MIIDLLDIVICFVHEVVGSEDANVYFYYLTRPRHACVNKLQVRFSLPNRVLIVDNIYNFFYSFFFFIQRFLRHFWLQGHGYPIIGIAWNHGENLLASSDFGGTVIIWKRAKTGWERIIFGGKSLKSN